jgi:hypothetical protein
VVATLVRLRFLLLANTLRRNVWQLVRRHHGHSCARRPRPPE